MAAQDAQEFEAFVIGRKHDAQAAVGAHDDLPHEETGGEHAAIARGDDTVTGADEIGVFEEFERGQGGVVARQQGLLAGGLHRDGDAGVRVGQQDHARGAFTYAGDAPHEADAVHRGPAIADAVAGAHVQEDRLPEG